MYLLGVLNLLCINKLISIQMSEFGGLGIFLSVRIIFKLVDCTISIPYYQFFLVGYFCFDFI